MSVEGLRPWTRDRPHNIEHIPFYSVSKPVLISNDHDSEDMECVNSYRSFPSSNGSPKNSIMRNMTMPSSSAYNQCNDLMAATLLRAREIAQSLKKMLGATLQAVSISETAKKTSFWEAEAPAAEPEGNENPPKPWLQLKRHK